MLEQIEAALNVLILHEGHREKKQALHNFKVALLEALAPAPSHAPIISEPPTELPHEGYI